MSSAPANPIRYGAAALADVLGSVASALGAPLANPLAVPAAERAIVLVIDGLGWTALRRHLDAAPCLASFAGRSLTAGFPTTTATSLASIGTGLVPGQHGLICYTTALPDVPELTEPINWLRWAGALSGTDLRELAPPEVLQPRPTMFEQVTAHGIHPVVVAPSEYRTSGLTRAILRGGSYRGSATLADLVATIVAALREPAPQLIYAYLADQDLIGHKHGPHTDAWRMQLTLIDRAVELLTQRLPAGVQLLITADHGMVDVPDAAKIDYDERPELSEGVLSLAGESRVRFLHVQPGQVDAVYDRWRATLGDGVQLLRASELIAAGWLGPQVTDQAVARIGDLVAVSRDATTVVRRKAEPYLAAMTGQHGALTDDELLVPLLIHGGS